jgi:hypothetical protein
MDGVGMNVPQFRFGQKGPPDGGTHIIVKSPVDFEGIKENPIAIINHTAGFPFSTWNIHIPFPV